jgi:hypothetical protein
VAKYGRRIVQQFDGRSGFMAREKDRHLGEMIDHNPNGIMLA